MAYYGADHDPFSGATHTASARAAPAAASDAAGRRAKPTLVVDDVLLACCNHAWDLASANGAREVALEHLLHAMTRVPPAAAILEQQDIQVMGLRRESATAIADDIPIAPPPPGHRARTSAEVDAVLNLAAAAAGAAGGRPTAVADVLRIVLGYDRPSDAADLLRRHARRRPPSPARTVATEPLAAQPAVARQDGQTLSALEGTLEQLRSEIAEDRRLMRELVDTLGRSVSQMQADDRDFRLAITARLQRVESALQAAASAWRGP
jgi:hypothetical protein